MDDTCARCGGHLPYYDEPDGVCWRCKNMAQQGEEKNTLTLDTEVERLCRENEELWAFVRLVNNVTTDRNLWDAAGSILHKYGRSINAQQGPAR